MFQIKNFPSIVASMINHVRATTDKLTDFNVGSVNRTILEASAIEIDELYQNMLLGIVESIPASLYSAFSFDLLPPSPATGTVTFSVATPATSAITLPSGTTLVSADGSTQFITTAGATIAVGATAAVAGVRAAVAGSGGNVTSGTVVTINAGPSGVTVNNPAPISGGTDQETDEERQTRFRAFIATLSRGPIASVEYGAKTSFLADTNGQVVERVINARCVETFLSSPGTPPGYLDLYLYNGSSGASASLIAQTQQIIDGYHDGNGNAVMGWKAAGIVVRIFSVTVTALNVALNIVTSDGQMPADRSAAIVAAVAQYIASIAIGATVYKSALEAAALTVPGVIDAEVTSPASNTAGGTGIVTVAGTITPTLVPA